MGGETNEESKARRREGDARRRRLTPWGVAAEEGFFFYGERGESKSRMDEGGSIGGTKVAVYGRRWQYREKAAVTRFRGC